MYLWETAVDGQARLVWGEDLCRAVEEEEKGNQIQPELKWWSAGEGRGAKEKKLNSGQ